MPRDPEETDGQKAPHIDQSRIIVGATPLRGSGGESGEEYPGSGETTGQDDNERAARGRAGDTRRPSGAGALGFCQEKMSGFRKLSTFLLGMIPICASLLIWGIVHFANNTKAERQDILDNIHREITSLKIATSGATPAINAQVYSIKNRLKAVKDRHNALASATNDQSSMIVYHDIPHLDIPNIKQHVKDTGLKADIESIERDYDVLVQQHGKSVVDGTAVFSQEAEKLSRQLGEASSAQNTFHIFSIGAVGLSVIMILYGIWKKMHGLYDTYTVKWAALSYGHELPRQGLSDSMAFFSVSGSPDHNDEHKIEPGFHVSAGAFEKLIDLIKGKGNT
jgi:hypothetical protein